jgi:hypothetical protein
VLGPLHLVSYYDTKSLVEKVNELHEKDGFSKVDKHSGKLPSSWDSFSEDDKKWIEKLLCESTTTAFIESKYVFNETGGRVVNEQIAWNFGCQLI